MEEETGKSSTKMPRNDGLRALENYATQLFGKSETETADRLVESLLNAAATTLVHTPLRTKDIEKWQHQWNMQQHHSKNFIDIDNATKLCRMAQAAVTLEDKDAEDTVVIVDAGNEVPEKGRGGGGGGGDIRAYQPVPSGCFADNDLDNAVPVPWPPTATTSSFFPPVATCDPVSEDDGDQDEDAYAPPLGAVSDSDDGEDSPINI